MNNKQTSPVIDEQSFANAIKNMIKECTPTTTSLDDIAQYICNVSETLPITGSQRGMMASLESVYVWCKSDRDNINQLGILGKEMVSKLLTYDDNIVMSAFSKAFEKLDTLMDDVHYVDHFENLDYKVIEIINYLLLEHKCMSVFDPDARYGSTLIPLIGKYQLSAANLFPDVNIEAVERIDGDSEKLHAYSHADAIVSYRNTRLEVFNEDSKVISSFMEESIKCCPQAKVIVGIVETDWLSYYGISWDDSINKSDRRRHFDERRKLYDYIDMVIELPADHFGRRNSLIVLNPRKANNTIKMVNATDKLIDGVLDSEGIINSLKSTSQCIIATYEKTEALKETMPIMMAPHIWVPIVKDGETRYPVESLAKRCDSEPQKLDFSNTDAESVLNFHVKAGNYYDLIMGHRTIDHDVKWSDINACELREPAVCFDEGILNRSIHFYNGIGTAYYSGLALYASEKITIEYLALSLLNHRLTYEPCMLQVLKPYGLLTQTEIINLVMQTPIVFPDSIDIQRRIVDQALRVESQKRYNEMMANMERYGLLSAGADIKHMLGAPFSRQGAIIQLLKSDLSDDRYKKYTEALIDVSEYIQRVVTTVGTDISKAEPKMSEVELNQFVASYIDSYRNFGNGCFELRSVSNEEELVVHADTELLKLQLDTVLDNAVRHGFGKKKAPGNLVEIAIQPVHYKGMQYALVSIRNNGSAINPGFTISDYISKGRFDGNSGRTGLGGYHTYEIAKKHNGFLSISSDNNWSMIVEILIPLKSKCTNYINLPYDREFV